MRFLSDRKLTVFSFFFYCVQPSSLSIVYLMLKVVQKSSKFVLQVLVFLHMSR